MNFRGGQQKWSYTVQKKSLIGYIYSAPFLHFPLGDPTWQYHDLGFKYVVDTIGELIVLQMQVEGLVHFMFCIMILN